jgi:sugar phosphate isomerase/epimerase
MVMELGYMVSLKDFATLSVPGADFTELLLFDGDEENVVPDLAEEVLRQVDPPVRFVHVPEFIAHKGRTVLLDLSAGDEDLRIRSIEIVRFARDLAISLGNLRVVIHPGGIRHRVQDREELLSSLERSLSELGPSGLLLENMPWFYWHMKSERMISNICVSIDDMKRFERLVEGFTLDVCHGYLSKPSGDSSYCSEFLGAFGAKTHHLHVSDAKAPDSEGLEIGEGEIDFSFLRDVKMPILVEIWKGHEQNGRGFRQGIERLRALRRRP